jgi:nicotinamide mononucleotide transporter
LSAVLEGAGALLGLVYVLLAIRENRLCWIAGAAASVVFFFVFRKADLPMQALLQIYYVGVAIHGWVHWGRPGSDGELAVTRLTWRGWLLGLTLLVGTTAATLGMRSDGVTAEAVLDCATSWSGVLATWLVARKILEAWLWWIVIDLATIVLYLQAGLLASSALYALYTGLAYLGWREWHKHFQRQHGMPGIAPF